MAMEYRPVDRDQLFLLPPSMRDWLPKGHLALLVEEVVAAMDTSRLHAFAQLGGVGRAGYDPNMLFGLLVYGYAEAVHSSRKIESRCHTDIAFRYLCAQDVPDHSVIAKFRRRHADALKDLLGEVLMVAVRLGMGRFGHVAIDGTKIQANASRDANVGAVTVRKLAAALVDDGIAQDDAEDERHGDDRGDELPPPLRDRSGRKQRIADALAKIEQLEMERHAEEQALASKLAAAEARHGRELATAHAASAAWEARRQADGICPPGRKPGPAQTRREVAAAANAVAKARTRLFKLRQAHKTKPAKVNLTDPNSRLLPVRGGGFIQGYNCMFSVSDDQLITDYGVHDSPHDAAAFIPVMDNTVATIGRVAEATNQDLTIDHITADAGFDTDANLAAHGPDRLIAQTGRRGEPAPAHPEPPPPAKATARQQMAHRLATPDGKTLYKRRSVTVEPVNGQVKDRIGLRQFLLRGATGALTELGLAAIAHNIRKIHTHLATQTT